MKADAINVYFNSEHGFDVDVDLERQEVELFRECSCGYDVYITLSKADLERMMRNLEVGDE